MTDTSPTVWDITPHTRAKHAILKRYLDAWLPILTRQAANLKQQFGTIDSRRILYVDGFAGPGVYRGGEHGSPVIALRAAVDHSQQFPFPVEMLFIEEREDRYRRLCEVLAPELEAAGRAQNVQAVEPLHGDCDAVLHKMLDEHERQGVTFGPALAFFDQFGYGSVSMELTARILTFPQCEVFTYLDYKDMNRWITDPHKAMAFDRAYGGGEWRDCIDLPESERRTCLLALYKDALKSRARARYVTSFLMFDAKDQPLYWLIFCTNHLSGLYEMKRAMWAVDGTGGFKFSDRDNPGQLRLLNDCFDQSWLAEELRSQLAGRRMTVAEVREYVLTDTPCYRFKNALKTIEGETGASVVDQPVGRKPGTYPDNKLTQIVLQFAARLF
jgi:three-Cys-motif partner protein